MTSNFIYPSLDTSRPSIRLLAVHEPTEINGPLICHLEPSDLDHHPPFAALSYVWGSPSLGSELITLDNQPFRVGINLAVALRFFRDEFKTSAKPDFNPPVFIWVDALCINQADNAEKADQIGRMDLIYKSASIVISHLGLENDLAKHGAEAIRELGRAWNRLWSEAGRKTSPSQDPKDPRADIFQRSTLQLDEGKTAEILQELASALQENAWESVQAFLDLSYWTRIWIIQEIVLARDVVLVLPGTAPLSWTELRDAKTFASQIPTILDGFRVYDPSLWSPFEGTSKLRWDNIELIREYKEGSRWSLQMNGKILLPYALHMLFGTSAHRATDPRDKLFGLLGICELPIQPDYQLPVREVYMKFGLGCVWYELFNVLLWAGNGLGIATSPGLPSWIPDWQAISNSHWRNPIRPEWYEASGWIDPFPGPPRSTQLANLSHGFALTLRGYYCGSISKIWRSTPLKSRALFDMCFDLRGSSPEQPPRYKTGIPLMQGILRTFCLDHALGEFEKSFDFDDGDFDQVISTVLDFLSFILPEEAFHDETGKLLEESLTKLGLDPNFHFPKTLKDEYFPNHTHNIRTEIDLSTFSDDALRQGFPGQSLSELRKHPVIRRRGVDVVKGGGGMPSKEHFSSRISSWMDREYSIYQTTTGYLGVGPPGMQEGDDIYVIWRCSTPLVLRHFDDNLPVTPPGGCHSARTYQLVGSCFLLGFMNNELGVKDDSDFPSADPADDETSRPPELDDYIDSMFPSVLIVK